MSKINEIKAQIYDEVVKRTIADKNIAILEQQLQQEMASGALSLPPVAEKPAESV